MAMKTMSNASRKLSIIPRAVFKVLIFSFFIAILGGAMPVPFHYETQTLWYKTGAYKVMLRTGQLAGLLALVLIVLQIFLSIRGRLLEDLFSGKNLMRWHKTNGIIIAFAAVSHAILVLAPEGINNLPIEKKYWPEWIGAFLLLLILFIVVSSHFRSVLKLDYTLWRNLHKPMGYLVVFLVLIHVLFVSGSFEQGTPKALLLSVFTGLTLLVATVKTIRWNSKVKKEEDQPNKHLL